jgi:hypothetical protein
MQLVRGAYSHDFQLDVNNGYSPVAHIDNYTGLLNPCIVRLRSRYFIADSFVILNMQATISLPFRGVLCTTTAHL